MRPTPVKLARLKVWLDARLSALFAARPFPPLPFSIECEMHDGLDFRATFQEYGFTPDGFGLLPNFYEIQKERTRHAYRTNEY
jgi:hypothetical protein